MFNRSVGEGTIAGFPKYKMYHKNADVLSNISRMYS